MDQRHIAGERGGPHAVADASGRIAPLAPRPSGVELHLAGRIDNYRHIALAFGAAAAAAVAAEVCEVFRQLITDGYFDGGAVLPGDEGHFNLIMRGAAHAPASGSESLPALFAIVWSVLCASPIERNGVRIPVALSVACAREVLLKSAPDRDARLLDEAQSALARMRFQGEPPEFGGEWAVRYRGDMAAATAFFYAIDKGDVCVAWQPVRGCAGDGDSILYHEALLRSLTPRGEAATPRQAIALLERLGLVANLDRLMVRRVIEDLSDAPHARLGVNISGQSACRDPWWDGVMSSLAADRGLAGRLFVEITATAPLPTKGDGLAFAKLLHTAGCHLVLDDFGVGQASFWSLLGLTPDVVKVDGTYLRRAMGSERDRAIFGHIVGLATALAPLVVIEGADTAELSRFAAQAGGTWQQGYFPGRPSMLRSWAHADHSDGPGLSNWPTAAHCGQAIGVGGVL